jgi:hypothetical protein
MRRTLLAALLLLTPALLLTAGPAAAYTIFLKDGGRLEAREKYRVQGDKAIVIMPNGSRTELPLAAIDVARTERGNASNYGDARVVDNPAAAAKPTAPPQGPSLSDVAANRRLAPPPPRATPAAAAPAAAEAPRAASTSRTTTGSVDFLRTGRTPLARVDVGTTLGELLRAKGVESAAFYEGSQPGRVLVELTTNSEGAVFQALAASSLAIVELEAQRPGAVEALELFMATDRRQRAGQFLLTPERARELTGKQLDVAAFFVKYVEF